MRIGNVNTRSYRHKQHNICMTIEDLKLDVLCISETWFNQTENYPVPENYPKYHIHRQDRRTHGGGVATIVKNCFKVNRLSISESDWKFPHSLEFLCRSIQLTFFKSIILCVIYRTNYINNDLSNLEILFELLHPKNKNLYIVGDFNVNFYGSDKACMTEKCFD